MRLENRAFVVVLALLIPLASARADDLVIEDYQPVGAKKPATAPATQAHDNSAPTSRPAHDGPLPAEGHKLLARLAQPDLTPEERQTLVGQVLAYGQAGAKALQAKCQAQWQVKSKAYRILFYQEAQKLGRSKLAEIDKAQAKTWQDAVNAPRREKKVTKEVLHDQAGPALEKLMEALVVRREEVLAVEAVAQRRRELEVLEETLDRCRLAAEATDKQAPGQAGGEDEGDGPSPPAVENGAGQGELERTEEVLALMGTAMKASDRRLTDANYEARRFLSHEEFAGLLYLNVVRAILDLNVMRIDGKLCLAARDHSKDMVEKKFFSHSSPVTGKASPWDRARRAGTSATGECIAAGTGRGAGAIRMWFFSPGHHVIILGGSGRVSLGGVGATWTLMTGG